MKMTLRTVQKNRSEILYGEDAFARFGNSMVMRHPGSRIFILTDENTRLHCLPILHEQLPALKSAVVLDAGLGEDAKSIDNAGRLWRELSAHGADRYSLLLNLGGGVVTDLGGFVAAGYHRGIRVIHIPTTLIGQVDAALGGKTAVNLGHLKNQVGFFYAPAFVLVYPGFLKTLPSGQLISGLAELGKNLLLGDPQRWNKLAGRDSVELVKDLFHESGWKNWLIPAARFKVSVVKKDYSEKRFRKVLNFGHTVGHALESLHLEQGRASMFHGNAVAYGMVCTAWLSGKKTGLQQSHIDGIINFVKRNFGAVNLDDNDLGRMMELIRSDKKSRAGVVMFTLLRKPGDPVTDIPCAEEEIRSSLVFCRNCMI
jgi:3-dehydroquinate synthase